MLFLGDGGCSVPPEKLKSLNEFCDFRNEFMCVGARVEVAFVLFLLLADNISLSNVHELVLKFFLFTSP